MDVGFWWGLAAAIPLGIVTNLVTPGAQRYLARRSSAIRQRQQQRREADLAFATTLAADPIYYSSWLAVQYGRLLIHLVVLTVFFNVPFMAGSLISLYNGLVSLSIYAASLTFAISLITIILNLWRRIRQVTSGVARIKGWRY